MLFNLTTKSLCHLNSSPASDTQIDGRISACFKDISAWKSKYHLKLNLGKTELLFLPRKHCPLADLHRKHCFTLTDCQEPWGDPGQQAVRLCTNSSKNMLLQVRPLQHPKKYVCSSRGSLPLPGPLQYLPGRATCQIFTAHLERSCRSNVHQPRASHRSPSPIGSLAPHRCTPAGLHTPLLLPNCNLWSKPPLHPYTMGPAPPSLCR